MNEETGVALITGIVLTMEQDFSHIMPGGRSDGFMIIYLQKRSYVQMARSLFREVYDT